MQSAAQKCPGRDAEDRREDADPQGQRDRAATGAPTPRRRDLRDVPTPEELSALGPADLFGSLSDVDIRPMPGGCLVSVVPRRGGPRRLI